MGPGEIENLRLEGKRVFLRVCSTECPPRPYFLPLPTAQFHWSQISLVLPILLLRPMGRSQTLPCEGCEGCSGPAWGPSSVIPPCDSHFLQGGASQGESGKGPRRREKWVSVDPMTSTDLRVCTQDPGWAGPPSC